MNKKVLLLFVLAITWMVAACTAAPNLGGPPLARRVTLGMFDSSASRIAITTSENSLWLEAIFTFAQVDFNRGNANIVTEFEVKTSLSQDWTDVPDQYVDQIANGYFPESNEERIQLGQFTAGNHVIIARATFWDGEVVYANPITITVLPAEE